MASIAIFVLALPILVFAILWAVLCVPLMMIVCFPVWGMLTFIELLKGQETHFWAMIWDVFTMGFQMYGQITGFF